MLKENIESIATENMKGCNLAYFLSCRFLAAKRNIWELNSSEIEDTRERRLNYLLNP